MKFDFLHLKQQTRDFSGIPVVKSLLSNAEDVSTIPS